MDLGAYSLIGTLEEYVTKHYGEVPRLRGIRLMKLEDKTNDSGLEIYDSYCGKDVIYIHTRCGSAWYGDDDPDANYISCGGKEFDERNSETFIESVNDEWDGTYRDHYFQAVIDSEYKQLIEALGASHD